VGENYTLECLIISTLHQIFLGDQFRRMNWTGQIARWGSVELYTWICWENLRKCDHLENTGLDGRKLMWWIFRYFDVRLLTGSMWLKLGTGGGHFECGNEPSDSTKWVEFLDWL